MSCVNQSNGEVNPSAFPHLKNWKKENTLYSLLKELRKEMEKSSFKSLKQPPEGSYF